MRLSYKFNIDFTEELKQQFVLAKNLYNQANHHIKEIYKKEGKYCNYYDMDKYVKNRRITIIINSGITKLSRKSGKIFSLFNFIYNMSVNKIIITKKRGIRYE